MKTGENWFGSDAMSGRELVVGDRGTVSAAAWEFQERGSLGEATAIVTRPPLEQAGRTMTATHDEVLAVCPC